jgi:D,D-heptose 1,7-bisphosphate phosphatase
MRRTLVLLAKAATSVLLLYLSLRWVNLGALTDRLSRLDPAWIVLAVLLMAAQMIFLSIRWRQIAIRCGAGMDFGAALQINFIAAFFNQVLPSTVGGDGVRIWLAARKGAGWASATYSVLLDRIFGVFVLALFVIACLPWTLQLIRDPAPRVVLIVLAFGAIAGPLVLLSIGLRFRQWLGQRAITRHLSAAAQAAGTLCGSPRSAATVFGCSIAIHLLTITAAWCCIRAVAAPVGFAHVLFLTPPVLLLATVPISIAGWGVRESSMIAAFAYAGLAESDGLTLSILFGVVSFVVGIVGGIVWIVSGVRTQGFGTMRRPAAFLDRDGVLNVDHGYVSRPEQLEWIAGAPEGVRLLNEAGYYVLVVTNQSGVARGYFDEAAVESFHAHMQNALAKQGAHIDAFYYCPHHPEGTIKALTVSCSCRKPGTGMLEQAAREWPIDKNASFFIGDKDHDMAAAAAFNIRGIKFDPRSQFLPDIVRQQLAAQASLQGRQYP